jgi:hypothetical protein
MRPDFDDLVGTDLGPTERARLERVHDLLVAAGPPPDFAPDVVPVADVVELPSARRRRGALIAIAAALAVALFAFGGAFVNGSTSKPDVVAMQGTPAAPNAAASIRVLAIDAAGNWPMRFTVSGLVPAPSGRPFELWLTRDGKPAALCGSFATDETGAADVPMNAPYKFSEYDGWRVVEEGSPTPLLTT